MSRNPTTIDEMTTQQKRAFDAYLEVCLAENKLIRPKDYEDYGISWVKNSISANALMNLVREKHPFEIPPQKCEVSKEELLDDYIRWVKVSKVFFVSPSGFKSRGLASKNTYQYKFGSIDELIRQAKEKSGLDFPTEEIRVGRKPVCPK